MAGWLRRRLCAGVGGSRTGLGRGPLMLTIRACAPARDCSAHCGSEGHNQDIREPGDRDRDPGEGEEEPGDRDQPGDGDREPGDGGCEPSGDGERGDGERKPGGGREPSVDGEPGDRDRDPGDGECEPADRDAGSGTIYVLAMTTVVVLLASAGLALGQALIARHRAAAAADLSAISAASRVLDGPAGACEAAAIVARSQGARLTMCRIDGEVAEVTVVVQSGFLSVHYPATGAARAGPADPTLSNP